jgi:GT2 family glycosyltransferase
MDVPLVLIESDVIIQKDTLVKMLELSRQQTRCGMLGAVTTNEQGEINFPYLKFRNEKAAICDTTHSISFCCTLLSPELLKSFSFGQLSDQKDWYDVFISRKSRNLGFHNYLVTTLPVIHKPHSSRPWKLLKYSNPLKYYFLKYLKGKDRI